MEDFNSITSRLDMSRLPRHVAMIMDGNGRWARRQMQARSAGHAEGVSTVRRVTELSSDLGIKYLTLYAFSTENWNRPSDEVDTLMYLIGWAIERELPDLIRNNVKIHLIGDIDRIPPEARQKLLDSRDATANCSGLNLSICLSYSSRWEITRAARILAEKAVKGEISPNVISEEMFNSALITAETANIPDVDLLIRTGGEKRISNYLLWQIAYSELYFTDILWPDFSKSDYADAIADFQNRERRFGLTSDQINPLR
ncbi:MAG: isoprenyl transferase [Clostridium sp.]|nr:isoprenyl transferase [Prevotella sp.]MCM1429546.1 isoprenyl transferase [Clostridium sp.]MCM1476046.1 isoprenyl transferase [Muribaculaceae bacterium]